MANIERVRGMLQGVHFMACNDIVCDIQDRFFNMDIASYGDDGVIITDRDTGEMLDFNVDDAGLLHADC